MTQEPKDHIDNTPVTDHDYDGIREYDNPTPGWWVFLFVLSVVFSILYFTYYHVSPAGGASVKDNYESAVTADLKKQFGKMGELKQDDASLMEYMGKADLMLIGKSVFKGNCVSCHAANGEGQVGPNLTDDVGKNIHVLADIPKVINNGAGAGAMPSWKQRLHPNEVALVAAYVASLRGQNLPGRAPEGTPMAPWPMAKK